MARYWFVYNPGGSGETDPTRYVKANGSPSLGCNAGQDLCAVYAYADELTGKPYAGQVGSYSTIFCYIATSRFLSGMPYPPFYILDEFGNPSKPFVYMKS